MILAVDQGTTGTTCLVVDDSLRQVGRGYCEIAQYFPEPGWVEHDPAEIWSSVLLTAEAALADAGIGARDLAAVAIANQRETTVVWERRSGRPVQRAIVWQDRRTAARCSQLPAHLVRARTGLLCDPYFSASKLEWILGHCETAQEELAFGTIDSWLGSPQWDAGARGLICGLTRGTTRAHLVRAALEAIAHQVADVLDILPVAVEVLRVDGGATANRFLMQFQADLIDHPVEVAADAEATALGAAALAGLAVGIWPDLDALGALVRRDARYEPTMSASERAAHREGWQRALGRATMGP